MILSESRAPPVGSKPGGMLFGIMLWRGIRHMAEIVAGFGVPHTPVFPFFVERDGPDCEIARLFRRLTEHLEEIKPDLIVMFDTDHLNTFFLDNLPIFALGVADDFRGPIDEVRSVPVQTVKSRADVASHLRNAAVH